ncbi:hypothetical protein GPJ56_008717 [Histomonas meleagridis]|uniref:uncharacterized protein n=1 Tax=Histomonas meleagridis TaxID=135588 RepID=UPI00355A514F|nr:hypothetical protein GPJ56_008717 [Histomonas meleagridis]KAH0803294.1 hypothetical protein GO595_004030 [Histomonas meleagridis]
MDNSFHYIHQQIIQEKQLQSMLSDDVSRQRQMLDTTIRKLLSDLRSFCFLDTWYPRLSMSDVSQFLHSSIYKREDHKVYESPSNLPFSSSITLKINSFLKAFNSHLPLFLRCVNYYFSRPSSKLPYNPCDKPLSFFASSTLPSLFGYCWCVEEAVAYVHTLCDLLKLQIIYCGSVTSYEFRNSFIREIIRMFMHMTGVQKYLQLALSTDYWTLINDEELAKAPVDSPEQIQILVGYVKKFTEDLLSSLSHMPTIIRYFFKVISTFNDADTLIEFMFFDYLLQPALLNPKLYALIPETAATPTLSLTTFTRLFRWSINPSTILQKFSDVLNKCEGFKTLGVKRIIDRLSHFSGEVTGIYSKKLQEVTNVRSNLLLTSANDVLFISKIISDSIDHIEYKQSDKDKLLSLCSFQSQLNLETDELIDFWYHSFKLPEIPSDVIVKSKTEVVELVLPIMEVKVKPLQKDEYYKIISHLINYLQDIRPDPNAPNNLLDFLKYQKERALQNSSTEMLTKTQAIENKIIRCKKPEKEILNSVSNMVTAGIQKCSEELALNFELQECYEQLSKISKGAASMNAQLVPIIHQALLHLFFHRNKDVKQEIERNKKTFLSQPKQWNDFLIPMNQKIIAFAQSLGLDQQHHMKLTRQFHSELLKMLTFANFLNVNKDLVKEDKKVTAAYDKIMKAFMKEKYSSVLTQLFNTPSCFDSVVHILDKGTQAGAPLERLEQIGMSMDVLHDIYLFEAGEGCPGDDFLPLFVYALLRTKLPNLASLCKYLENYLMSAEESVRLLEAKEKFEVTTFLSAADYIMQQVK